MKLNKMVNKKIDEIYKKYEPQLTTKYPDPVEIEQAKIKWQLKKQIEIYQAFKKEVINEFSEKEGALGGQGEKKLLSPNV